MRRLKILAVNDPAVQVYTNPKHDILRVFEKTANCIVDFEIVEWNEYYGRLVNVFDNKEMADIVMVAGHFWLRDFVDNNYLKPINIDLDTDVMSVINQEMFLDNKRYLVPSFCDGHVIVYRTDEIEMPTVVSTDEYMTILKRISTNKRQNKTIFRASKSEVFLDILPFMRQEGVEVLDEHGKIHYDSSKMQIALEKYLGLKKYTSEDVSMFGNDEVAHYFKNNKATIGITWGGQLGVILDDECVEPETIGFSTFDTAWNVTWSFAVPRSSNNDELTNEFLKYISSTQVDRKIGAYAGSPTRKSTYELDREKYAWYPMHEMLIKEVAKPLPSVRNASQIFDIFYKNVYESFIEKISIEEAVRNIEKELLDVERGLL